MNSFQRMKLFRRARRFGIGDGVRLKDGRTGVVRLVSSLSKSLGSRGSRGSEAAVNDTPHRHSCTGTCAFSALSDVMYLIEPTGGGDWISANDTALSRAPEIKAWPVCSVIHPSRQGLFSLMASK